MIIEEKCTNCEGMGYLLTNEDLFDTDKKVCPVCFGIGYVFKHKRGAYEKSNS